MVGQNAAEAKSRPESLITSRDIHWAGGDLANMLAKCLHDVWKTAAQSRLFQVGRQRRLPNVVYGTQASGHSSESFLGATLLLLCKQGELYSVYALRWTLTTITK
jgi:hypothetical protein